MEQPDREASLQHSADHLSSSDPDVVANALAKIRTELRTSSEEGARVIKVCGFSPPLLTLDIGDATRPFRVAPDVV